MRERTRTTAAVVGGAVVSVLTALSLGTVRWNHETGRVMRRLTGTDHDGALGARVSPPELSTLPRPVQRYFHFALAPVQRRIRGARVTHRGEFQSAPWQWNAFTSVEYLAVQPPGFVWDANIRMAPLLSVHVRDSYMDGEGSMQASAAAVLTMLDREGTPELAEAALQRWLGEAVWLPTALLPMAGVRWEGIDDRTARATIRDRGIEASLLFQFGDRGEIERCSGDRYRDLDGGPELTPWEGRFGEYTRMHGMMIPACGEAAWLTPAGRAPYWRGQITSVDYDFE